ncbi:MAG: hypothetical protein ISR60_04230 [Anaerolineales bacterium]|nr:hypothetical protein [Anaerolineales bacterium]
MKKYILWFVLAAVMVVTLISVTGAAAAEQRPPMIPALGPGQFAMPASSYPAYPGGRVQNYVVFIATAPGTACFINPYASVGEFGHIHAVALRQLDNGKWVNNQMAKNQRTEVSVGAGYQRCAEVPYAGIWAFQGW